MLQTAIFDGCPSRELKSAVNRYTGCLHGRGRESARELQGLSIASVMSVWEQRRPRWDDGGGYSFPAWRSRMTIDPHISTRPGRSTSGLYGPGRRCAQGPGRGGVDRRAGLRARDRRGFRLPEGENHRASRTYTSARRRCCTH